MELYFHQVRGNVLILSADGGIDSTNAEELAGQLETLIQAGARNLIVDCSKLGFISSYGLAVLVRLHKRLARVGGDVRLAAVQSRIVELLELTRLARVLQIYPNVDDAIASIGT
jgi:anti-sigma B factor antagonist